MDIFRDVALDLPENIGFGVANNSLMGGDLLLAADVLYKEKQVKGFCHLYDGQEAVATGINAAFDPADDWITSYRCHCVALARGGAVKEIVGELFGLTCGMSQAKGGSMHFYNKSHNFYGGQGIVGAQVTSRVCKNAPTSVERAAYTAARRELLTGTCASTAAARAGRSTRGTRKPRSGTSTRRASTTRRRGARG